MTTLNVYMGQARTIIQGKNMSIPRYVCAKQDDINISTMSHIYHAECNFAAGDGEARRGHGPLRVHRPRAQHGRAHQQLHLQTGEKH